MKVEVEQQGTIALTVKIYGMDEEGRPFFEPAVARRLTTQTALLEGMQHRPQTGAILGVQCKGRKARAQVVWICEVNQLHPNQMGIRLLLAEPCPWQEHLDPTPPNAKGLDFEQRRHPRYKIGVALDLQQPDMRVKTQVQCSDISLCGCYVQTMLPLPVGTLLIAGIWIGVERIETTALVRACDGNVGMGIEFMNLTQQQEARLQQFFASSTAGPVVHR